MAQSQVRSKIMTPFRSQPGSFGLDSFDLTYQPIESSSSADARRPRSSTWLPDHGQHVGTWCNTARPAACLLSFIHTANCAFEHIFTIIMPTAAHKRRHVYLFRHCVRSTSDDVRNVDANQPGIKGPLSDYIGPSHNIPEWHATESMDCTKR